MKRTVHPYLFVLLLLLPVACNVREGVDDCLQYALTVKAIDVEGNELTGTQTLTSVDIYLFDRTGFVRMVPAGTSSDFYFAHDKTSALTLVAWGNLKADSLELPQIAVGTPIGQATLALKSKQNGYNLPITDLFYSKQVMEPGGGTRTTRGIVEDNLTLVLERRAAGMSVRTLALAEKFGNTGESCQFVVRGTGTALNFLGQVVGDPAGYEPRTVTDPVGDGYAAPFRVFPTGEERGIEIDIFRAGKKLHTLVQDTQGTPLYALPGHQLDVIADFRYATLKVTVNVVPWGQVSQETEM